MSGFFNKGEAQRLRARGFGSRAEALADLHFLLQAYGDAEALGAALGVFGVALERVAAGQLAFQETYLEAVYGPRGRKIRGVVLLADRKTDSRAEKAGAVATERAAAPVAREAGAGFADPAPAMEEESLPAPPDPAGDDEGAGAVSAPSPAGAAEVQAMMADLHVWLGTWEAVRVALKMSPNGIGPLRDAGEGSPERVARVRALHAEVLAAINSVPVEKQGSEMAEGGSDPLPEAPETEDVVAGEPAAEADGASVLASTTPEDAAATERLLSSLWRAWAQVKAQAERKQLEIVALEAECAALARAAEVIERMKLEGVM